MQQDTLAYLRCPLDPVRLTTLREEREALVCEQCAVRFPMKQGLPILIAEEAELPADCRTLSQLPCRKNR